MFRSAVIRTAGAAARVARPAAVRSVAPLVRSSVATPSVFAAAWKPIGLRMYSAGGALTQSEVESRITTLLGGFDKVNDPKNVGTPSVP